MSIKKVFWVFVILVFLGGALGAGYGYYLVSSPQEPGGGEEIVRIKSGQGFKSITSQLAEQGIVQHENVFYFWARITGKAQEIQAGHFEVDTSWSVQEILEHLTLGKEKLYRLQIPEGLPWWEVGRILEEREVASFEEFREVVHDQDFLEEMGISAPSAEGFLYPETYYLSPSRDVGAERLARIMIDQFWRSTQDLWEDKSFNEVYEAVKMASLIEKETGVAPERKKISGVFHNRLNENMLLQCDPTVIYGLGKDFEGRLRRKHLDDEDNPYNTYQHRGFPPTPICSPGRASLTAALNPEKHSYYYFVSKNDGTHHFSKTLQEHNRAVYRYQIQVR